MALTKLPKAFKAILKTLQTFENSLSATTVLGINSQGFFSILDKFPRNWNEVTTINILGTLKLAQNFIFSLSNVDHFQGLT